eukprot:364492-Chlamydomonas_euryale.AAC.1
MNYTHSVSLHPWGGSEETGARRVNGHAQQPEEVGRQRSQLMMVGQEMGKAKGKGGGMQEGMRKAKGKGGACRKEDMDLNEEDAEMLK